MIYVGYALGGALIGGGLLSIALGLAERFKHKWRKLIEDEDYYGTDD